MTFYHLLAANTSDAKTIINSAELDFADTDLDGKFGTYEIKIGDSDKELLSLQIQAAYSGIKQRQFEKLPKEKRDAKDSPCGNCAYRILCWGEQWSQK